MRRSLAPSKITSSSSANLKSNGTGVCSHDDSGAMVTIKRMPLFGFLEIPEALNRQFKVPSGCVITEKNIELRKVKTLGMPKNFKVIRPGDLGVFRVRPLLMDGSEESIDIDDAEQLPTTSLPPHEPLILWTDPNNSENKVEVIPELAYRLRPHQREGVQFLFECTMGIRGFDGQGCILADDMGLGKTLMSITAMWTLLNQGFTKGESAVKKVVVVCPTSLVGNWDNEIRKWVGDRCPTFAVKADPKRMIKTYLMHRGKGVLIISYDTQRRYSKMFENASKPGQLGVPSSAGSCCDLLICDEAHKLKNADTGLSKSLNLLPAKKRILLSGTPMQNELTEFFNMVNFCNPNVLGSLSEFRRNYERPILAAREPDALETEVAEAAKLQKELSVIVNEFILKRGNILNAQHLPPKLVQFVCCRLTPLQEAMCERLLDSKEMRHIQEGKMSNTLNCIRRLINICSHPKLILDSYNDKLARHEEVDEDLAALVEMIPKSSGQAPQPAVKPSFGQSRLELLKSKANMFGKGGKLLSSSDGYVDPEQSGKMAVLFRMMQAMRAVQRGERIVIVSNFTSTLDLIENMCKQNNWPALRLDGTISGNNRTKLVDEFNNTSSNAFAFLLSSKAGGCGINLIGGNRLVLFDPDWNPASDKQAAARIWREGQKRRCFIYRFMSTGSIEEKIIQRQLAKEGLVDIVDDKEQINQFSSEDLKQLFVLQKDTRSDTHDTLQCKRCKFVKKRAAASSDKRSMSKEQAAACLEFLNSFETYLVFESTSYQKREEQRKGTLNAAIISSLPFQEDLEDLRKLLSGEVPPNLTIYSRKQRSLIQGIDDAYQAHRKVAAGEEDPEAISIAENLDKLFPKTFSIYSEFLKRWTDIVPTLMSMNSKLDSEDAVDEDGVAINAESGDFVEQEGCPEETDFNKWSHHCSPLTCDDELFAKALGDDEALVTFTFGLEINFSLLEQRELEQKEENERRKQQQLKDLEELNARRKLKSEGKPSEEYSDDEDDAISIEGSGKKKNKSKSVKGGKGADAEGCEDKGRGGEEEGDKRSGKNKSRDRSEANDSSKKKKNKVKGLLSSASQPTSGKVEKGRTKVGSSENLTDSAAAAAVTTERRRSSAPMAESRGNDNRERDILFESDYAQLKRLQSKGKLSLDSFYSLWKALKNVNNNWRIVPVTGTATAARGSTQREAATGIAKQEGDDEIFTRTPGLKAENLYKYAEGVDYFLGKDALLSFMARQCRLHHERDGDCGSESTGTGNGSGAAGGLTELVVGLDKLRSDQHRGERRVEDSSSDSMRPMRRAAAEAIPIDLASSSAEGEGEEDAQGDELSEGELMMEIPRAKKKKIALDLDLFSSDDDDEEEETSAVQQRRPPLCPLLSPSSVPSPSPRKRAKPSPDSLFPRIAIERSTVNKENELQVQGHEQEQESFETLSLQVDKSSKSKRSHYVDSLTAIADSSAALETAPLHRSLKSSAPLSQQRIGQGRSPSNSNSNSNTSSSLSSSQHDYFLCDNGSVWNCEMCTFENSADAKRCDMCRVKRFGSKRHFKQQLSQMSL